MKSLIAAIALAITATSSFAGFDDDWIFLANSVENDKYYVNSAMPQIRGRSVFVWTLTDYGNISPSGDYSSRMYIQFDCENIRVKTLSIEFFTGPRLTGNSSGSVTSERPWRYLVPGSVMKTVFDRVCKAAGK